jgi:hypothetical protein
MKVLATCMQLAACALLLAGINAQAQDKKADPVGTWTWSVPGRDGATFEQTLKLKMEGDKLAGVIVGNRGGTATETKIEMAKLTGDELSFQVTRERQGNSFTTKYKGKISGDTITGKMTTPGRDGGEARDRDWEAKRKKDAK